MIPFPINEESSDKFPANDGAVTQSGELSGNTSEKTTERLRKRLRKKSYAS